jgi:hypothetical protein
MNSPKGMPSAEFHRLFLPQRRKESAPEGMPLAKVRKVFSRDLKKINKIYFSVLCGIFAS